MYKEKCAKEWKYKFLELGSILITFAGYKVNVWK